MQCFHWTPLYAYNRLLNSDHAHRIDRHASNDWPLLVYLMAIAFDFGALYLHRMHQTQRPNDKSHLNRMNSALVPLMNCVSISSGNYHLMICFVDLALVAFAGDSISFAVDCEHFRLKSVQWFASFHHRDCSIWSICYYFDLICLSIFDIWYRYIVRLICVHSFDCDRLIIWSFLWWRPSVLVCLYLRWPVYWLIVVLCWSVPLHWQRLLMEFVRWSLWFRCDLDPTIFDSMKSISIYFHSWSMLSSVLLERQFYFHSYQLTFAPDSYLFSRISSLKCLCWHFSTKTTAVSISFWLPAFRIWFLHWFAVAGSQLVFQMILWFVRCSNLSLNRCVRCVPTKIHCSNLFASIFALSTNDPISPCWTTLIYPASSVWLALQAHHSSRYCHCLRYDSAQHMDLLVSYSRFVVANWIFKFTKKKKQTKKRRDKKWEKKWNVRDCLMNLKRQWIWNTS